jgi:hypothetical protein
MASSKKEVSTDKNPVTTHSRMDSAHCLAGIFQRPTTAFKQDDRLDISYRTFHENGDEEIVTFSGKDRLNDEDLKCFLGLVALGGMQGLLLEKDEPTQSGNQLQLDLRGRFLKEMDEKKSTIIKSTMDNLLKETGKTDGGKNFDSLRKSLQKMESVSVKKIVISGQTGKPIDFPATRLLSYGYDGHDQSLFVALNPRITESILGERQYVSHDMPDMRAISNKSTLMIWFKLCGWINFGKTGKVTTDTLIEYVWGGKPDKASTTRQYRTRTREAIKELENAGWLVNEYSKDKWEITRPVACSPLPY